MNFIDYTSDYTTLEAYVGSLNAKYDQLCALNSQGESIRGKTWEDMTYDEKSTIVGEMEAWDPTTLHSLGITFGKGAIEKAGGALYGAP